MANISNTLSYQDAYVRLSNLSSDTEEYRQLQEALSKTARIVEINLPTVSYKVSTFLQEEKCPGGFGSSEHYEIGREVDLKGIKGREVLVIGKTKVPYEYIIALAGDFYGVYGEAISLPGGTSDEKTTRFQNAFNTLDQADPGQVRGIMDHIEDEHEKVMRSPTPHHCYSYQMMGKNNAIKKIKGDIDNLLIDNSDHFSKNAEDAYLIGHRLAMQEAKKAGLNKDEEGLKRAYALDAFACHFLTDLFAAGHIRNQRGELELFLINELGFGENKIEKWIFGVHKTAKTLSGLLTGAQHEQDGNAGLNVFTNYLGNREVWRAFGDGRFFSDENKTNRNKVKQIVQQSVDEVYAAYEHQNETTIVPQLIPHVTDSNSPPLYSIEGKELFLNHVSGRTKVDSKLGFLNHAVGHAMNYLPQEYIDSVLSLEGVASIIGCHSLVERSAFMEKAIIPMAERITGSIWHVIGVATFHQVKKEFREQNDQLGEMANLLDATFKNTEKIIEKINEISTQLAESKWDATYSEIKESVADILDAMHLYADDPKKIKLRKLESALNRMSRVFTMGTADKKMLLASYRDLLIQHLGIKNNFEVKAKVTLWFRQMLTLQVNAFCLYSSLKIDRGETELVLQQEAKKFEKKIFDQIEANKVFIDLSLIYQHEQYIELQMCKDKTREKSKQLLASYSNSPIKEWQACEMELSETHFHPVSSFTWDQSSLSVSSESKKKFSKKISSPMDWFYDEQGKIVAGAKGFPNIGNSCYMNSILQVLNAFSDVFPINTLSDDNQLLNHLHRLRLFQKGSQVDEDLLKQLRQEIFRIKTDGELTNGENAQQDAHELLTFLLDKMKWVSGLKITTCRSGLENEFENNANEIAIDILIPIIGNDFQIMLDDKFKTKKMTDKDPLRCIIDGVEKKFNSWNERIEILEHPPLLIIHLERFDSNLFRVNQKIDFPKDHRVMIDGKNYDIVAFVNHIGDTMKGGHYTTDIKKEDNNWIRYNDHLVTESQLKDVDKHAYIVILKQVI